VSRIQTVDCTFNSCSDRISNVLVCRWTEYSTNIYLGDMNPTELADFGEDEGDAKCHATRATYTTTSSYVSRQSNSHSTYRTSSPRSRLLVMFKDPPMHVDPPHPSDVLALSLSTRMAAHFGEGIDGKALTFYEWGMLGIVVESSQNDGESVE